MVRYFLHDHHFSDSGDRAPARAVMTVEVSRRGSAGPERRGAALRVKWTETTSPPEVHETEVAYDEARVLAAAAAFPAALAEKVRADYHLGSGSGNSGGGGEAELLELYKFQAGVFVSGLEIIKKHRLADAELLAQLGSGPPRLEASVPLVAALLQQEGIPELRWWEEQAENFVDLWFPAFRRPLGRAGAPEGGAPAPAPDSGLLAPRLAVLERKVELLMDHLGIRE